MVCFAFSVYSYHYRYFSCLVKCHSLIVSVLLRVSHSALFHYRFAVTPQCMVTVKIVNVTALFFSCCVFFSSSGLLYSNGCGDSVHISFYYASKPSSVHTLKCRLYAACHCFQRLPYFCLTQHTYHLLFLRVNLLSQPFPHHLRRSRRDFNKTNAILLRTHKKTAILIHCL